MELPEHNLHPDRETIVHRVDDGFTSPPVSPKTSEPEEKKEKRRFINFGAIFLGVLFIFFGFAWLGKNLGIFPDFSINFFELWPLLIIVAGLSLISGRGWMRILFATGVMIVGLVTVVIFGAVAIGEHHEVNNSNLLIEQFPFTQSGDITVHHGLGSLNLSGDPFLATPFAMLTGDLESNFTHFSAETNLSSDGTQYITVDMEGDSNIQFGNWINNMDLSLSENFPMDLTVESGASEINLDLQSIILQSLDLDTGASSVEIVVGNIVDGATMEIDAGVSEISIGIPANVGVELHLDTGLTEKNISDFHEVSDGVYRSNNYDNASKHMNAELKLGVAELTINFIAQ
ncbi:MAG: DUF5668 domain-containing protein [Patescibacteria group bacterium]|jgi:hypothetical protein